MAMGKLRMYEVEKGLFFNRLEFIAIFDPKPENLSEAFGRFANILIKYKFHIQRAPDINIYIKFKHQRTKRSGLDASVAMKLVRWLSHRSGHPKQTMS